MGGWLLVFTVCWLLGGVYSIYNAITGIVAISGYLNFLGAAGFPVVVALLIMAASGIASLALCYFIYNRNSVFLRFYQLYAIAIVALYIIVAVILAITAGSMGIGAYASSYIGTFVGSIVGSAIGVALLTMYFCKSERVRVYMGSDEYLRRAIFRVGM